VAEFVGTMNRIPGVAQGGRVQALGTTIDIRSLPNQSSTARVPGSKVDVLVRPEALSVTATPNGRGIVMTTTFLGSVTRLGVLLDEDVMVYVDQPSGVSPIPVGSAAEVALTESSAMVADPSRDQFDLGDLAEPAAPGEALPLFEDPERLQRP
jgi:putative spermidine/putrescine transport system ATP-binding protein